MIDAGAAPDEARRITSAKAEDASALLQGAVATFGDRFTGKLVTGGLDPLLARVAGRSVLGKTAAGAGISALEEGTQELAEGVASDLGTKSVASGKESARTRPPTSCLARWADLHQVLPGAWWPA